MSNVLQLEVGKDHAVPITPLGGSAVATVASGDSTVYYADTSQVSSASNQGSIAAGGSHTFTAPGWLISAGLSAVTVTVYPAGSTTGGNPVDVVLGSDGTVGGPGGTALVSSVVSSQPAIDLCRGSYNVKPGDDITTPLQNAINAIAATSQSGEIYFSVPGTYLISGAQQTGSALGYNYSGQILFPALTMAGPGIAIRIRGTAPAVFGDPVMFNGTILQSNAASGNVFDVIPASTINAAPFSNLLVSFKDLTVTCPANPQCGGINAAAAARFHIEDVEVSSQTEDPTTLTGTGIGLQLPKVSNASPAVSKNLQVTGFPTNVTLGDHSVFLGDCYIQYGITGIQGTAATLLCHFAKLHLGGNINAIGGGTNGGAILSGTVGWESGGRTSALLINDPGNQLSGSIKVALSGAAAGNRQSLNRASIGQIGGQGLNVSWLTGSDQGWMGTHPVDNFRRALAATGGQAAGVPGACSDTAHPYRLAAGSFSLSAGVLKGTNGGGAAQAMLPVLDAETGGRSRVISTTLTTGTSYNILLYAHTVRGGGNNGKGITANVHSSAIVVQVNGVTVATVGTIAASTTYTAQQVVSVGPTGVPTRYRLLLGGVQLLDYSLSAAQQAVMGAGTTWPVLEDGYQFSLDTLSSITRFAVSELIEPPFVASGTATLAAGTVAVANTSITANSLIRVWRTTAGGTLGELSYALSAGVGFTVNSNNAADTSAVYYEIVNY